MNRTRRALAALALLAATACTTGPSLENQGEVTAPPGDSRELTVGSAGFTESDLLAQMYALLLENAGYSADIIA
ncbi:ABC transporter substrate-binding protein, partial [Streptomyces baarnensis]